MGVGAGVCAGGCAGNGMGGCAGAGGSVLSSSGLDVSAYMPLLRPHPFTVPVCTEGS